MQMLQNIYLYNFRSLHENIIHPLEINRTTCNTTRVLKCTTHNGDSVRI